MESWGQSSLYGVAISCISERRCAHYTCSPCSPQRLQHRPLSAVCDVTIFCVQSWHWENRNYNKYASEQVRERLLGVAVTSSDGLTGKLVSIPELKVEASVNIRKGKKIAMFEITFTAAWEGKGQLQWAVRMKKALQGYDDDVEKVCAFNPLCPRAYLLFSVVTTADAAISKGEAHIVELMPDDLSDDFDVRQKLTGPSAAHDDKALALMKTAGSAAIRSTIRAFYTTLVDHDGGQEKLALDAVSVRTRRGEGRA
jgi:hypothetical protein